MNVTKSRQVDENTLEIEGIASSPIIDVDNERFTADAVKNMLDSVNAGGIPVRVEHENKFYSDIGTWKEAKLID